MIDIVLIGFILLCGVRGGSRGFWLTLLRIFGFAGAVFLTWTLHPAVKAWLGGEEGQLNGLRDSILGPFIDSLPAAGPQGALLQLADILSRSQLPEFLKGLLLGTAAPGSAGVAVLNDTALSLLSFIGLLLAATLAIQGAALLLDRFFRLPGLNLLNRAVGMVLGAGEGLLMVWVLLAVLTPWVAFRPEGSAAVLVGSGELSEWLYQHNILLKLINFKH